MGVLQPGPQLPHRLIDLMTSSTGCRGAGSRLFDKSQSFILGLVKAELLTGLEQRLSICARAPALPDRTPHRLAERLARRPEAGERYSRGCRRSKEAEREHCFIPIGRHGSKALDAIDDCLGRTNSAKYRNASPKSAMARSLSPDIGLNAPSL